MFKILQGWLWFIIYYIDGAITPNKGPTQTLFVYCDECNTELVADEKTTGEYIDQDQCIYRYTCGGCAKIQSFDFCIAPVPIKVDY